MVHKLHQRYIPGVLILHEHSRVFQSVKFFNLLIFEFDVDQERVQAKDPPHVYLDKLRTYLDPKATRSSRVSLLCLACFGNYLIDLTCYFNDGLQCLDDII